MSRGKQPRADGTTVTFAVGLFKLARAIDSLPARSLSIVIHKSCLLTPFYARRAQGARLH